VVLQVIERPLAGQMGITAHSKNDADVLGMFFNADYFGNDRDYLAGATLTAFDFITVDGRFRLRSEATSVTLSDNSVV
ncbi:MAG: hypothetical protein ACKODG_08875, partial [Betaproteobacteria bacterium]